MKCEKCEGCPVVAQEELCKTLCLVLERIKNAANIHKVNNVIGILTMCGQHCMRPNTERFKEILAEANKLIEDHFNEK